MTIRYSDSSRSTEHINCQSDSAHHVDQFQQRAVMVQQFHRFIDSMTGLSQIDVWMTVYP